MMTNLSPVSPSRALSKSGVNWGWLLALGIFMTGLGVIGLGMTYWLTVVAVFWFGVLAVVGGIAQILDAFHHKGWGGIVWHLIIGVVYVVGGFVMITMPVPAAFWLTLVLAISLVVVGMIRVVMAIQIRGQNSAWGAVLLSGITSIALGILVYGTITPPGAEAMATAEGQLEWFRSWAWVIGLFVAIELIMEGVALIAVALAAKSGDPAGGAVATPAG